MRFSADHAQKTRDRIVKHASAQFRERGPNGLSIADLMRSAGLTHGGFYAHFPSREALVKETLSFAMEQMIIRWTEFGAKAPTEAFATLVGSYLSEHHRDNPAEGCALPSFGADIGRFSSETRKLFSEKLVDMIRQLSHQIEDEPADAAHQRATFAIASLVGTIVLARAAGDKGLSDRILRAGRESLLGLPSRQNRKRLGGAPRRSGAGASSRKKPSQSRQASDKNR
jgi:TetR/AcrR family transcriptional regulator, transcriptional repressor for nem operon